MRNSKPQFHALEDVICDIAEILNELEFPYHEVAPLVFVTSIRNQYLFSQVALPPKGIDVKVISLKDYELKDVMLGRTT